MERSELLRLTAGIRKSAHSTVPSGCAELRRRMVRKIKFGAETGSCGDRDRELALTPRCRVTVSRPAARNAALAFNIGGTSAVAIGFGGSDETSCQLQA